MTHLWRWIEKERQWGRRTRLRKDFSLKHHSSRTFDDSWLPRRRGVDVALAFKPDCDFAPGGVVWRCFPGEGGHPFELTDLLEGAMQRLEADLNESSARVRCSGPASIRAGFTYPAVELVVCDSHEHWLRRHGLLNGLNSGVMERS